MFLFNGLSTMNAESLRITYLWSYGIVHSEPLRSSTPYKQYSKHEDHRYGSLNRSKVPGTNEVVSTYESSIINGEPSG